MAEVRMASFQPGAFYPPMRGYRVGGAQWPGKIRAGLPLRRSGAVASAPAAIIVNIGPLIDIGESARLPRAGDSLYELLESSAL